jgi:hypothetical protein
VVSYRRAIAFVATAAITTACSVVLGINDRSLLPPEDEGGAEAAPPIDAPQQETAPVDAGPQRAVFSGQSIDFGFALCGGAAPANRTFSITNLGGAPLTFEATLASDVVFSFVGANAGTVQPGASASLTLSAQATPAYETAGATQQTVLTIVTNDPAKAKTDVGVKVTAGGGDLELVPLAAAFGESPTGVQATDIPVTLKNTGNVAVTVGLGMTGDSQYSLVWTGAPAAIALAPGATMPGLVARFKPTTPTSSSTSALITTTGNVCGVSPSAISMSGKGTNSTASVQPGLLDFGMVGCGTQAGPQSVTLKNTGGSAITWSASLLAGTAYTLNPMGGSLAAATSVDIVVTPKPIPSPSAVTANLYGDTLTITTNAPGDSAHVVDIHETASGAILTTSTGALAFGSVTVGNTGTSPFTVSNAGNAAATVSFSMADPAFSLVPQAQAVGAGGVYTATVSFTPSSAMSYSDTATMTAPGVALCAPLPSGITLTGTGTAMPQPVTVAPMSLDFGRVDCGSTGSPQNITITNNTAATLNWTAALTANTSYQIGAPSGMIAAGAQATLTITPKLIPQHTPTTPDLFADTLTITTDAPGDTAHAVSLHMTAQGVILSFSPTSLSFGTVAIGDSKMLTIGIVNDGNVVAPVTLTEIGSPTFTSTATLTVGPSSSELANVTFTPTAPANAKTGNLRATTTAKLCAAPPNNATLGGTAQ